MCADDLIALIMQRPFVPYTIRLRSGAELAIDEWHHAATNRSANRCTVWPTGGDAFQTIRFQDIKEVAIRDPAAS